MRGIYKKIGIVIIVLLLGVGSAILWQSSKQTKPETRFAAKAKRTLQTKEYSHDQRKALLDEALKGAEVTIAPQITLAYKEHLQATAEDRQKSAAEAAKREKLLNLVSEHLQRYERSYEDSEALDAHMDKVLQEGEVLRRKTEAITPLLDRLEDRMDSFLREHMIELDTDNPIDISIPIQTRVQEWHDALYEDYFHVILIQDLTQEEINTVFPTPEAQRSLQTQQADLQTELAARAEHLLSESPGNRAEKLTIIRQTLSENWSPDIAENVMEQLREE